MIGCGCWEQGVHAPMGPCALATTLGRHAFVEAREAVIGNWLPRRGIRRIRAPSRAHARIAIERRHPNADFRVVVGIATEEVCTTLATEALFEAARGMAPPFEELLALHDSYRAAVDPRLRRRCGACPSLAARAMTVASAVRRLG